MSTASITFIINATIVATIAISLLGNLISIIIFSRKTFRNNSISTYCIALSINELLSLFRFSMSISNIAFNVNIADQSDTLCKVINYIPAVYSGIQPLILVAFSIDKLMSMRTTSIAILKKILLIFKLFHFFCFLMLFYIKSFIFKEICCLDETLKKFFSYCNF